MFLHSLQGIRYESSRIYNLDNLRVYKTRTRSR